jgi:hypothetical protein
LLHRLKGVVDLGEGLAMRNELVNLELALKVIINETGQLGAALDATESGALPDTTGDKLEGYSSITC